MKESGFDNGCPELRVRASVVKLRILVRPDLC
jgi:hypothetical protein